MTANSLPSPKLGVGDRKNSAIRPVDKPAAEGSRIDASAIAKNDAQDRPPDHADQVSFIIQHMVKPEYRERYEAWLHKIIEEAGTFKGHLGAHIVRPAKGEDLYEISVRFATREDAERWMHSEERRTLVREAAQLFAQPEHLDIKSGVDYWFTSATNGKSPKVWKQWLTTVSVIWPLSMLMPHVMGKIFQWIPPLGTRGIAQLLSAMVMVGLLTWVIMPPYTRALRKWLSR
jgi:Uncharacterized protein conserved in bacteria